MADVFSHQARSRIMSRVKNQGNRSTELKMVALLRAAKITGWRRHLPLAGKPDFTFVRERVCVFVDGCFWHGCPRCYGGERPKRKMPTTNAAYWRAKIDGNKKRDRKTARFLRQQGYSTLRVRECELGTPQKTVAKIKRSLKIAARRQDL